jgi:hypothetical protein
MSYVNPVSHLASGLSRVCCYCSCTSRRRPTCSSRQQLSALVNDFVSVQTAEFLITHIEVDRGNDPRVRTTVRFDVTGSVSGGWRGQRIGRSSGNMRQTAGL